MQEELRRQEAARRAFVSTASHELRTPLTMLQGTMELLEEDIRSRPARRARRAAPGRTTRARELDRLSALSGELLDLSRLDAAVPLRSEPVELGEIVRAVAAEFELRARERSTSRRRRSCPTAPCWGRGDPDAVARVVRILLDNALRYGPRGAPVRGRGALGAAATRVITVADEGPGIPPEERDRIFERFHRGSAAGSVGRLRPRASRSGASWPGAWAASSTVDGDGGARDALRAHAAHRALAGRRPPRGDRDRVSA